MVTDNLAYMQKPGYLFQNGRRAIVKGTKTKIPCGFLSMKCNILFLFILVAESESFVMNATPYSPFDADKSPKNLGYLGRGYDVLFGNPLDESGRVDPGKPLGLS
jgi:hypothetical protein